MKNIVTGLLCVSIVSAGMFFSACRPPINGTETAATAQEALKTGLLAGISMQWDTTGNDETEGVS